MPRMGHVFARLNGYGVQLIPYWPIAIVSKRLGHSKIDLTSDTYGHLIGTAGKQAAEASAALVPRRRSAEQDP